MSRHGLVAGIVLHQSHLLYRLQLLLLRHQQLIFYVDIGLALSDVGLGLHGEVFFGNNVHDLKQTILLVFVTSQHLE